MKKITKIFAYIISIFVFMFNFVGCAELEEKVTKIEDVKITKIEMVEGSKNEIYIGDFNYDDYSIIVTYSDSTTKTLPLDETMLSNDEYLKTFNEGQNTLKINYEDFSLDYDILVKKYEFSNDICIHDLEVTYDGNYHTIEVEGSIPENTTITYPNGNQFVNAGTYAVSAIIEHDYYVTKTIVATLKIKKGVCDMSNVKFEDKVFAYDGTEKSIEVENVPVGIVVTYSIGKTETNAATVVGEYEVVAHFDAGPNYEPIEDLKAKLTIVAAN